MDDELPRSRRALLFGAMGGLAAIAAQAIGRPGLTSAANGDEVKVGAAVSGTAAASVNVSGNTAIRGVSSGGGTVSGVFGSSTSGTGRGITGLATAASGTSFGVLGQSDSTTGRGVRGYASTTTGANHGVSGKSNSGAGVGVYGEGVPTGGRGVLGVGPIGVQGRTGSPDNGVGVDGLVTVTSGGSIGVRGKAQSPGGIGIKAQNTATDGDAYGLHASTSSPSGSAIRAVGDATTGTNFGLRATSRSPSGAGIWAYNDANSGGRGILATGFDGNAVAIQAENFGTTGDAIALLASTDSATGTAIWGVAPGDSAVAVKGNAAGDGIGVVGVGAGPDSVGGMFQGGLWALQVVGALNFTSAGRSTIPNGAASVAVTGTDLGLDAALSTVLCTLLSSPGGSTTVQRVQITGENAFTIFLTANATADTAVGWFAIAR